MDGEGEWVGFRSGRFKAGKGGKEGTMMMPSGNGNNGLDAQEGRAGGCEFHSFSYL